MSIPKPKLSDLEFALMDGAAMYQRFCQEHRLANRDVFENIRYLDVNEMLKEQHVVCFTDRHRLVGDLALQQSPDAPEAPWLKHISVDERFRRIGIATRLVDQCVDYIRSVRRRLEVSTYSEMGVAFIAPIIERAIQLHPDVEIVETRRNGASRLYGI